MRTTRIVETTTQKLVSITCDKCHKEYKEADDDFEIQEFHCINFTGGYGSVFGDETTVICDICQRCLYEMIKNFMITTTFTVAGNM